MYTIVEALRKQKVPEENLYKCACYIIENYNDYKENYIIPTKLKEYIKCFELYFSEHNNIYTVKDKTDRMECCQ